MNFFWIPSGYLPGPGEISMADAVLKKKTSFLSWYDVEEWPMADVGCIQDVMNLLSTEIKVRISDKGMLVIGLPNKSVTLDDVNYYLAELTQTDLRRICLFSKSLNVLARSYDADLPRKQMCDAQCRIKAINNRLEWLRSNFLGDFVSSQSGGIDLYPIELSPAIVQLRRELKISNNCVQKSKCTQVMLGHQGFTLFAFDDHFSYFKSVENQRILRIPRKALNLLKFV